MRINRLENGFQNENQEEYKPLEQILAKARSLLSLSSLTEESLAEAESYLRVVLSVEGPGSKRYLSLRSQVVQGYIDIAREAHALGDREKAHQCITAAISLSPDRDDLKDLQESYEVRKRWYDKFM